MAEIIMNARQNGAPMSDSMLEGLWV
jgi:hypothetical protein